MRAEGAGARMPLIGMAGTRNNDHLDLPQITLKKQKLFGNRSEVVPRLWVSVGKVAWGDVPANVMWGCIIGVCKLYGLKTAVESIFCKCSERGWYILG